MVKNLFKFLIFIMGSLLAISSLLFARQHYMMKNIDPLSDTGASFGLIALQYATFSSFGLFALLIIIYALVYNRR